VKKGLFTLVKIVIAVVGVWFVVSQVRWNDTATLMPTSDAVPALRNVRILEPTEVQVLGEGERPGQGAVGRGRGGATTRPETVTIKFGSRKVHMEVEGQQLFEEVREDLPTASGPLGLPNVVAAVPVTMLQERNGERVQKGLKSLLVRASGKWYLLVAAWGMLGLPFLVTAIRWRSLMRPQGIRMPLGKCLQLTFVGQFYSIMLPGITGGDLVKIVYAARLTGSKTKSFITIILDRVIGLVALMVIAGASAAIQLLLNKERGEPLDNTLMNVLVMILVLLGVLTAGAVVYFSRRLRRLVGIEWFVEHFGASDDPAVQHEKMEHLFRVVNVLMLIAGGAGVAVLASLHWGLHLKWAEKNTLILFAGLGAMALMMAVAAAGLLLHELLVKRMAPVLKKGVEALVHVDETLHVYRGHFGLLVGAFVISLISQMTLPLSAWLSGMALGMTAPVTHYLAYVPVAVLAASMPVSPPQGFGLLDGFILYFFVTRGPAQAGQAFALAQAVRFLPIVWNLIGAYWVVTGSFSRHKVEEEERALEEGAAGVGASA
jgi:uncharacterized membrane protein YbhN (UPF0104 family)